MSEGNHATVAVTGVTGAQGSRIAARLADHGVPQQTERFLAGAGIRHTVLRAGIYASTPAALADEEFIVSGPASTGRAAFVTHEDIADVITAVALDESPRSEHNGAILEITGPEALTLDEAVTGIAAATGRPYRFEPETLEEAFARRWRLGISGEQIETWISWFQAIEKGEVSVVTDVVPRLTGSPATPISDAAWWPEPKTARGIR